ncbi:MAG: DUF3240 family protein [Methylophilaceae bacterium]
MTPCLLTLITSPSLEEAMIDWLLMQTEISGFSTSKIDGHGAREKSYSALEQVTGRQKKLQFVVHTETTIAAELVAQLKQKFKNTGLHYYITPIIEFGSV